MGARRFSQGKGRLRQIYLSSLLSEKVDECACWQKEGGCQRGGEITLAPPTCERSIMLIRRMQLWSLCWLVRTYYGPVPALPTARPHGTCRQDGPDHAGLSRLAAPWRQHHRLPGSFRRHSLRWAAQPLGCCVPYRRCSERPLIRSSLPPPGLLSHCWAALANLRGSGLVRGPVVGLLLGPDGLRPCSGEAEGAGPCRRPWWGARRANWCVQSDLCRHDLGS